MLACLTPKAEAALHAQSALMKLSSPSASARPLRVYGNPHVDAGGKIIFKARRNMRSIAPSNFALFHFTHRSVRYEFVLNKGLKRVNVSPLCHQLALGTI